MRNGWHQHKCTCGFLWEHSDANAGKTPQHTCVCGEEIWYRHDPIKGEKVDYVGCDQPIRAAIVKAAKTVKRGVKKAAKSTAKIVRAACKPLRRKATPKRRLAMAA